MTPTANDPIHTWNGYDIALICQADNGVGMSDVNLFACPSGSGQWAPIGPSNGEVWAAQDFTADVAAKGGFDMWFANLLKLINMRLTAWAMSLQPAVAPPALPTTFAEFQAWVKPNLVWTSDISAVSVNKK